MSEQIQITEQEIAEAASRIRVLAPPDLPTHQHSSYIRQGIYEQLMREKTAERDRREKAEKATAIQAELQRIEKENEEKLRKEAETARARAGEQFTEALVRTFFEECPFADEEDFRRNKTAIRDAIMRERVLARFRGRETSTEYEKTKLRETGDYKL